MKSWSKSHRFIFLQYESPYKKQKKKSSKEIIKWIRMSIEKQIDSIKMNT